MRPPPRCNAFATATFATSAFAATVLAVTVLAATVLAATVLATPGRAQVHVLGAVEAQRAPAPVDAGREQAETTVLDVISVVKPALNADLANAVILRFGADDPLALQLDVREMLRSGDTSHNVVLVTGDVVFLPAGRAAGPDARGPIDRALDAAETVCPDDARGGLLCLRARHGGDGDERARAVRELCDLTTVDACVLPTLRACLADAEPVVVREAVTALGVLGPRGRAAADQLRALCDHGDRQIRARAKAALARVSAIDAPTR